MQTLNANDAKTRFGAMLMKVQSEPVEIIKNGSSVAVIMSIDEFNKIEQLKMDLVKSRFEKIDENGLVDGKTFFKQLESGNYD